MQKIKITNLGPIKYFESDINKYTIIIGEQGTGKSTIAKSIYFFRNIKGEIIEYLLTLATSGSYDVDVTTNKVKTFPSVLNRRFKDIFVQLFGFSWNLNDLYMKYDFGKDIFIETKLGKKPYGKKFINLQYSQELKTQIIRLENEMLDIYGKIKHNVSGSIMFATQERTRLQKEVANKVNQVFDDFLDTFYIPAGRSLLTLMANQRTRLDYDSIDLVNRNFMNLIESLQPKFDLGIDMVHKYYPKEERNYDILTINKKIIENLKGNYKYDNGKEYFIVDGNTSIPLNYASSGQQEMLWILNQLYILLLSQTKSFVIIEEPEAHLFPKLQKEIIDFIATFANLNDSNILLTTHSPYVLTSANTLLSAGRIREKSLNEVNKIMGKYRYFLYDKFNAYILNKTANEIFYESIVDKEMHEILSEKIDEISDNICEEYTKLFYLEEEHGE